MILTRNKKDDTPVPAKGMKKQTSKQKKEEKDKIQRHLQR